MHLLDTSGQSPASDSSSAIAMALMKLVPLVPGHFTVYEWLALAIWIALGAIAHGATGTVSAPLIGRSSRV